MAERVGRTLPGGDLAVRAKRLPPAVWFVLLVAAALVVAIVVAVVRHNPDPLHADISGISPQSDPAHFTFTYDVTKNPLSIAECVFQVQGEQHEVIATTTQRVEPTNTNDHTTRHTVTVDTTQQGVSAVVDHCQLLRS